MDALRLCYKSFFWTAFCIFEHSCIACLAAVIDSPEVTWCKFRSPLLFSFLSNTQALDCIILVYWMYGCKCIISNNNSVLCQTGQSLSLLLFAFSKPFEKSELRIFIRTGAHVTHVIGSFNRRKWQKRKFMFIVSDIELPQQKHLLSCLI